MSNQRRVTNVAPGIFGTDAVNVAQLNAGLKSAYRGIAMSMAMGATITPSAPGKTTVNLGAGTFGGEYAMSLVFSHRLANVATPVYISGGIANSGIAGGNNWGGRMSVGVEF